MSLEIAWAFACYRLGQDAQSRNKWNEELTELLNLSNLGCSKGHANVLIHLTKPLYSHGLGEIKEHYGLKLDTESLQVMKHTYEGQLLKIDGRGFSNEDKKRETKKRYENDILIYTNLLKKKEKILEKQRASSLRKAAESDYTNGKKFFEVAVQHLRAAVGNEHAEAQQMLAKLIAAGLIVDNK